MRLILVEHAGLDPPSLATRYGSEADHAEVQRELGAARVSGEWRHVVAGDERAFDVAEMVAPTRTSSGWDFPPLHVGLVVVPGWLIHVERATAAVLVAYRHTQVLRNRIVAFWRHRELIDQETGTRSQDLV